MALINDFPKGEKSSAAIIKFMVNHREDLHDLLKHITWEDVLDGRIIITKEIIDREIKPVILDKAGKEIESLDIRIQDGVIAIFCKGKHEGISFKVNYIVKVEKFIFNPGRHAIILEYKENISSLLNIDNKVFIGVIKGILHKILGKTFVSMGSKDMSYLKVGKDKIEVDLDKIPQLDKLKNNEFFNTLISIAGMDVIECSNNRIVFKIELDFNEDNQEAAYTV
jgi:hypothetical protein